MEFKLHLTGPGGEKQVLDLNDHTEFKIGRGPRQDVQLLDPEQWMSREHLVVANTEEGPVLTVKGTNGLSIAGQHYGRGQKATVEHGSVVEMGHWVMEVKANIPLDVLESLNAPPPESEPPAATSPAPKRPAPQPRKPVKVRPDETGDSDDVDLSNLTDESGQEQATAPRRSWWARAWSAEPDDGETADPEDQPPEEEDPAFGTADAEEATEDYEEEDDYYNDEDEIQEGGDDLAALSHDADEDEFSDDLSDEDWEDDSEDENWEDDSEDEEFLSDDLDSDEDDFADEDETLADGYADEDEAPGDQTFDENEVLQDDFVDEDEVPEEDAQVEDTAEEQATPPVRRDVALKRADASRAPAPLAEPESAVGSDTSADPAPKRPAGKVDLLSQLRKDLARKAAPASETAPEHAPEPAASAPHTRPLPVAAPEPEAPPAEKPERTVSAPEPDMPPAAVDPVPALPKARSLPALRSRGHGFFHAPHDMKVGTEATVELVLSPGHPMTLALREALTAALIGAGLDVDDLPAEGLTMRLAPSLTGDARYVSVSRVGTDQQVGPEDTARFGWIVEPLEDGFSLMSLDLAAEAAAGDHAFRVAIHPIPHSIEIVGPEDR